jgi:MFS family permease
MGAIASTPGARRLLGTSIVARLPLTMLSVGLLVHARHLTGSFAAAGAFDATYAVALGLGGPVLGRIVDRRGQTAVLLASSAAAAALLAIVALLPVGAPLPLLLALAGAIGAALPPLGACLRALVPKLMPDPDAARAFYAIDATALELTWISWRRPLHCVRDRPASRDRRSEAVDRRRRGRTRRGAQRGAAREAPAERDPVVELLPRHVG